MSDKEDSPEREPPAEEPWEMPVEEVLDLHAFRPSEILDAVGSYLEEAAARGFTEVRLIHGKGTGFQRERVQKLLQTHPLVARFADAPAERGHWGATLVWFRPAGPRNP
jgi:dsDNA-specific endonuclease/ATPase MutS2